MAKTDWISNDVVLPSHLNQIGEEINAAATLAAVAETPAGAQSKADAAAAVGIAASASVLNAVVSKGNANSDITEIMTLLSEIDTRSIVINRIDDVSDSVDELDGETVIRSTRLNRESGVITSIVEECNGKLINYVLIRNENGQITSVTKSIQEVGE